jgi:hypothetical protein
MAILPEDMTVEELVASLDPPDWVQLRLTASLSPADRTMAAMHAQDFAMSIARGAFSLRFPELTLSELNIKVLAHFTPIRIRKS